MASRNRVLELVKQSAALNGIDFVEVRQSQPTRLWVHFLNGVDVADPGLHITVTGGDISPEVPVQPIRPGDWSVDREGRRILMVRVPGRGDFSSYTLRIDGGTKLDPYFRSARFSFFAFCPSLVDCETPAEPCPDDSIPPPAIDYLAKDFESFRQALADFSTQRYPEWRERAEADLGMVVLEALSAMGDELSFIQDGVHRQAYLETATERRSLVRLARAVDYEPAPVVSAQAVLQCDVSGASALPAGIRVVALAPDASEVPFEIGSGLRDTSPYQVSPKWNSGILPYWWDDHDRCLPPGTTSMYVAEQGFGFVAGQKLLIDTAGPTSADPPVRQFLTLTQIEELTDPLYAQPVTRIVWRPEDALTHHHDLTRTTLAGNLVLATQGRRHREHFAIQQAPASDPRMPLAVARLGANSRADAPRWQYLHTLREFPVGYLPDASGQPRPEITLTQLGTEPHEWTWVRSLFEAGRFEEKFTLDPAAWRPVANLPAGVAHDYDGSEGATIRYGDSLFGELPNDRDVFEATYRDSRGMQGNVPADTITGVDPAWAGFVTAVRNPFQANGGTDAETDEQVRRRAPQAFRAITFRAVRPEDYNAAAVRLTWAQRAGTVFRWTGSWPTIFTAADPKSAGELSRDQHVELIQLLNRYRLAGYEAYAPRPRYVSFDLRIRVCARPDAFQGDVYAGMDQALRPVRYPDGSVGFFHFDNFTLGTPFERSRLEAAIQGVGGVAGVLSIQYRRRGQSSSYVDLPPLVPFGSGEIFRLDNDPNHPERGSYALKVEGGK